MAVTANQIVKKQYGETRSYPVAAVHIYEGTLVYLTAAGYATDVTATGVNGFVGIAKEEVDNSAGSVGDLNIEVWVEGDFELTVTSGAQAEVGSIVYGDDNYACVFSIGSTSVPIGRCVKHVSSTKAIVEIRPKGVGALPVAALTTVTIADAAGTPDYALSALTTSSPYGLATAAEAITLLYVIKNLQERVLALENRIL